MSEKEGQDIVSMEYGLDIKKKMKSQTILVVEDDRSHSMLIEEMLGDMGYAVLPADGGEAALTKLKWHGSEIDLILLDYEMPGMTGVETIREIRLGEKSKAWPHLPVVGFSASNDLKRKERCLASGMDDYVSKDTFMPKWRSSLEEVIKKWI